MRLRKLIAIVFFPFGFCGQDWLGVGGDDAVVASAHTLLESGVEETTKGERNLSEADVGFGVRYV